MNEKEMTIPKKKLLYSLIAGVGALLLIAAIVLTVYFATRGERALCAPFFGHAHPVRRSVL